MPASRLTVLHLAPHPDDETIGAGATLIALRKAGHEIINLACSLGRPADRDRRRAEVEVACSRADFELLIHEPPLAISTGDDLEKARRLLCATVANLVADRRVSVLVSPTPHDGHHGHEVVGRGALDALRRIPRPPVWWMWGLWNDLPFPTLVTPFDDSVLDTVVHALAAHEGEVARNDYVAMVPARATVNRVLGSEKAFGFGGPGLDAPYAELLTEAIHNDGWAAATPRLLNPTDPLVGCTPERPLDWWLDQPSLASRMRHAAEAQR